MAAIFDVSAEGLVRTSNIVPASSDLTIAVWIYSPGPPAGDTYRTFLYLGNDPALYSEFIWLGHNGDGNPGNPEQYQLAGTGPFGEHGSVIVTPGWHYFAYVRAGTLHSSYNDAVLDQTHTLDVSGETHTHLYLGTDTFGIDWSSAKAAYYREWDAVLTPGELAAEMLSDTVMRTANLRVNAPLESDLLDISGNGNHWSEFGGAITFEAQPELPLLGGSEIITETYSDHDMQCPGGWENGFKQGLVLEFGDGERSLSDPFTGEIKGSTFDLRVSDAFDRRFREALADPRDRFWIEPQEIKMTTRANRAALGLPYTVFVGPILAIDPEPPLALRVTLGDIIFQGILSDQHQIPWRQIRDCFLDQLETIYEALDLDGPEPIIYGQHRRIPDSEDDAPSPQGFEFTPIYLGTQAGKHVWMVAGHACADLPDVFVVDADGLHTSVLADPDWEIPHTSAPNYEDLRSPTYGNDRRYTLIRALVGNADADACAAGELTLTVFVDGVEPSGDGTGDVITDRIQQYKHFLINYVANRGPLSYQSGDWLTNPQWTLFGETVDIINEDTFDEASAIAEGRLPLPVGSPAPDFAAGYVGAVIIGARPSDRSGVRRWLAEFNRSCGGRFGWSHLGQIIYKMLHPTAAIKAAARLYTDAYEILKGSFKADLDWPGKVNRVPWRTDYEHLSGQYKTAGIASSDDAVDKYGGEILGDTREYPMAPGETAGHHLALMEVLQRQHPPKRIRILATIGPDYNNQSAGYLELGDYIRYRHYGAVSTAKNQIRLAQVDRHQVQAGKRKVLIEATDCEDLIEFDAPPDVAEVGSPFNDTCADAIEISPASVVHYEIELDTSNHQEDPSVGDLCGSPGGAFNAAWWTYTPDVDQVGHVTTGLSEYDTILAVYSGSCGSLTLEECNDNDGVFNTSFIEFGPANPLLAGVTYKFLVTSFGSPGGGRLFFTLFLEPA